MKIPICVPSVGHLLLLLRKFVNISVDLMTRGPPFGITQAYEAGEDTISGQQLLYGPTEIEGK